MFKLVNIINKKVVAVLVAICALELLSFLVFIGGNFGGVTFFCLNLVFFVICLWRFEIAFWVLMVELVIGSKGYLFYFEGDGLIFPIRISFWLILMSVWMGKILIIFKNNKKEVVSQVPFFKSIYFNYYIALGVFVLIGLFNGYLNKNELNNVFFDFNAWLYFLLIFPASYVLRNKKMIYDFKDVFIGAVTWLLVKTFLVLYLFSHNFSFLPAVYKWIRITGVGEITRVQDGFYRIFFQSHVFILIAFFLVFSFIVKNGFFLKKIKSKRSIFFLFVLSGLLSIVIITMSRSFWVSIVAGLFAMFFLQIFVLKLEFRKIVFSQIYLLISFIIGLFFIILIVKFPLPKSVGDYSTTNLLAERAKLVKNEAAISSRWSLLPVLWQEIKVAPFIGNGFGSTVTYLSSDPRVLETSVNGKYTTYAFEWAWLDIWLKIGLLGLLSYLVLVSKLLKDGLRRVKNCDNSFLFLGLGLSLFSVIVVNVFTPYLNHPLGIGFLIVMIVLLGDSVLKK